MEPGVGAPWRDVQIEHAKLRYGHKLTKTLDGFLRQTDLNSTARIGALRLAGHIADPNLALAIEACWTTDDKRSDHLAEYLWAFGECCGDDPARFLSPVCDAWAALPDRSDKEGSASPRGRLAAHEVRWAFHKWPPVAAINYFVERGSQEDLRWPITYMLHGMDHPKAVMFVVQELAAIQRHLDAELTAALDKFLEGRGAEAKRIWGESFNSDWITSEMIMRLPFEEAERLLLKHWFHLRFCALFVQAALYVSMPRLLDAAQSSVNECPEPAKLMEHLSSHFGIRTKGHPGITREAQVRVLAPYLHLLSPLDIWELWEACNDHGWFSIRRELLDERLEPPFTRGRWGREQAMSELEKMLTEGRVTWIDHWIDDFLKAGVTWSEILATMTAWLDERRSFEALRVVAAAVEHRGTREDLHTLRIYEGMPESAAKQLIADAEFAVRRRSIR